MTTTALTAAGRASLAALFAVGLAACQNPDGEQPSAAQPVAIEPGLVENSQFAYREDNRFLASPWSFTQHATTDSYTYDVDDEVLTLRRIGPEPWGQIVQRVNARDHAGQKMRYSAYLKASINDSFEPGIEPTGIAMSAFGRGASPMSGSRLLFSHDSSIPEELGEHDWQRHDIEFDLPDNATRLEIRIRLTRGGWLKVKYPSLQVISETDSEA